MDRARRVADMTVTDLADATVVELLELYRSQTASPVEAVEACLRRIDAVEPELNAVRFLRAEPSLADAAASADRWARDAALPLDGIPFGLKDIIATAGVPTTGGSSLYRDLVPTETASHAARLIGAGGIMLAKLETFEFACGGAQNRTFGPVHNPWDTERTTGGSSSGSGAAVAAGMVPMAIGTDTGGSIRIPAAYCGITGLKPTYGRVPRHGVMGLSWTLDHAGPMTRSAADAAAMLGVIAGHDRRDSYSSPRPVPDYSAAIGESFAGARVGRLRGWFEEGVHAGVFAAYDQAIGALTDAGVEVVDVDVSDVGIACAAAWLVCYSETLSLHGGHFDLLEDRDEMGAGLLASAPFVSAQDYLRALRYRVIFQRALEAALEGCVALALPGAAAPAPRLADLASSEDQATWLADATRHHIPFNYAGVPALCMPCGMADDMPASLQLVGMPHTDATLLALGAEFQAVTDHHLARPALIAGVPA
jgi:aspartyl-tRNA(Asn)/glutamyl-tRNA(Gln) amidotransferase subunit A